MIERVYIPLFPLGILPLPRERVPLHIFEPRYRELLNDIEAEGTHFGILYTHASNVDQMGSLMRLDKVLKKYDTGESDILVSCVDSFFLTSFDQKMENKNYSGGHVVCLHSLNNASVTDSFREEFNAYQLNQGEDISGEEYDLHDCANALHLEMADRMKYIKFLDREKREAFLLERMKYAKFIQEQEEKIRDNYFLN